MPRDIWPTIALKICFPSPRFHEVDRHEGRSEFVTRVKNMDGHGEARRKFATLPPDEADDAWHLSDADLDPKIDALVATLNGVDNYTKGALLSVCYNVVDGQIICDHCYQLLENDEPVTVTVKAEDGSFVKVPVAICYSWPSPAM